MNGQTLRMLTFYNFVAALSSNRLGINTPVYPCTFISCAQVRLEWLSSQQRTRAFYMASGSRLRRPSKGVSHR